MHGVATKQLAMYVDLIKFSKWLAQLLVALMNQYETVIVQFPSLGDDFTCSSYAIGFYIDFLFALLHLCILWAHCKSCLAHPT